MNLEDKKVLIVGTGRSGIAAAKLLKRAKANIILLDTNKMVQEFEVKDKLPYHMGIQIIIGTLEPSVMEQLDLVILSPGVPTDSDFVLQIKEKGIQIWGEVELAYHYTKGKIIAITGTNGKTTTTAFVGEMMKMYYSSVFVVGNIGTPYTDMVFEMKEDSFTVAEISSFQLETIDQFHPNISAILNITPDHLDRHHTMQGYIEAKERITKNQQQEDICVLNYEDIVLRELASKIQANVVFFSSCTELDTGVYLEEETIFYSIDGQKVSICNIHDLNLLGIHNYENLMAGIAIGISMGVPLDCIRKALYSFQTVEHRIEYVIEINGVRYYNDSKGTNPDAAIKGIQAMVTPTLLIGGGYDKDSNYKEWIQSFEGKVKYLVLLGQTKEKIAEEARQCGFTSILFADTLKEAVQLCAQKAEPGDSVLLSPACASWGMFENFEQRGKMFKQYVYELV